MIEFIDSSKVKVPIWLTAQERVVRLEKLGLAINSPGSFTGRLFFPKFHPFLITLYKHVGDWPYSQSRDTLETVFFDAVDKWLNHDPEFEKQIALWELAND